MKLYRRKKQRAVCTDNLNNSLKTIRADHYMHKKGKGWLTVINTETFNAIKKHIIKCYINIY